ncbi:MAG TPA: helix-turn-helix transcriptional regulator [Demequina sp.]|nr:helix-turn-helix transcriptional regulator [Demequina sp.]
MAHGRLRSPADVGRAVRHARGELGMSQVELAERLGVSQRWLSELETGKPKILDARLFDVLAQVGLNLAWSLDD